MRTDVVFHCALKFNLESWVGLTQILKIICSAAPWGRGQILPAAP